MATTINAGRVRFVSRGTYNNSTQYYLFDLVDYNGSSYIAKENTLGNLPTNTQYWQLIAEKGNTGNDGQTGPVGATGNGIASITKTGTSGLVDTYTITYTNGNTTTFTITNGEDANITRTEFEELKEENEDLKKNQLTNTPEISTSHYLQDSADSRFRKFIPIGRTTQESTTGKNLCTGAELQSNQNIKFYFDRNYLEKTFTLSFICNEALDANSVYLDKSNGTEYLLSMSSVANTTAKVTITLTDEQYNAIQSATYWNLRIYKGGASFTVPKEPMIQNGSTATDYEPYTGGEPAPNPNYPYAIKNTGDNGSVNEKVQNKNLLPLSASDLTFNTYIASNNGAYTTTTSGNYYASAEYINFNYTQETITLSVGLEIAFYDENKTFISYVGRTQNRTQTIPNNTAYIRIDCYKDNINEMMIIKGSTATNYVPHSEQNPSFPLAEGQKFYEGSHPDDDEKVHHVCGERILDGTENWEETSTATSGKYRWLLNVNNVKATSSTSEIPEIFSTHYKAVAFAGGNGTYNNVQGISVANYGSKIGIYDNTYNTDLTAWKAYLAEQYANGTPVKVIYPLAEETTEDFTSEQKTAWEEIKKARTYKNVTHISSEDETPANVEIEYVRDLETVINNLSN